MISKNSTTWASYDSESTKYFDDYSKLYFSNVHRQLIKFLPTNTDAKVLDIGCGSGRDALSLARRGYQVTAVEPSNKMLALAQKKNNHQNITWINDCLPSLLALNNNTYDFVLMSAVWMHIAPYEREISLKRIGDLLKEGKRLAITLRIGTPDTTRIMYPVSVEELLRQSDKFNLKPIYISRETKDSLSRKEITWKKIVFEKE
ncbi:class I SAM-dependent methyltransferase [Pseudomonas fluorescens]|nr:class I SAM-dependent methyltransferase [Pseudomonas fluorescens]QTV14992.1 class I SAM-dependent methyltransferase [Pseudomonas fluorescens]